MDAEVDIENLTILAEDIRKWVRDDRDMFICIGGAEGEGKSNLAIVLASLIDHKFDPMHNVIYKNYEVRDKLLNAKKYSAFVLDEAITLVYKKDHAKKESGELHKIFAQCRMQNMIMIFCLPRIGDANIGLREWRFKLWLNVTHRGIADVFFRDKDKMVGDPWNLDDKKQRRRRNTKIWMRRIYFPKMDPKFEKVYTAIKIKNFRRELESADEGNGKSKIDYSNWCLGKFVAYERKSKGWSYATISETVKIDMAKLKRAYRLHKENIDAFSKTKTT